MKSIWVFSTIVWRKEANFNQLTNYFGMCVGGFLGGGQLLLDTSKMLGITGINHLMLMYDVSFLVKSEFIVVRHHFPGT